MTDSTEDKYPNFALCLALREAGFPQERHYGAMYYVRPDILINIGDLSVLKSDGLTDFENIFSKLVFKPSLEDIIEHSFFLHEFIRMEDDTVFAYSKVPEDLELMKSTGRNDPFVRSRGATHWKAAAKLYIDATHRMRTASMAPEQDGLSDSKQ